MNSSGGRFRLRDLIPFGPGRHPRPRPFLEMAQVVWENRDNLGYAWRILNHGVCDGCSLGPRGLRDDVIDGRAPVHDATEAAPAQHHGPGARRARCASLTTLRAMSNEELHQLGRLPYPMIHRAGSDVLHRLSWDEALVDRRRVSCASVTGRAARLLRHLARHHQRDLLLVHQSRAPDGLESRRPVRAALPRRERLGAQGHARRARPDLLAQGLIGTDLVVIWGSHLAEQPAGHHQVPALRQARRARASWWSIRCASRGSSATGCRAICAARCSARSSWTTSSRSRVGGDIAFMHGVLKHLIEMRRVRRARSSPSAPTGFDELEAPAGVARRGRRWSRRRAHARRHGCASPSMLARGQELRVRLQHGAHAAPLRRGQREGAGQPRARARHARAREVRHHADPRPLRRAGRRRVRRRSRQAAGRLRSRGRRGSPRASRRCGAHRYPPWKGHRTLQMLEAAHRGEIDALYSLGGNLLETMPDRAYMSEALVARRAAHPPGHRAQHLVAAAGRDGAAAAGADALRDARRRHGDQHRAPHPLHARDRRPAHRRGAARVADPGRHRVAARPELAPLLSVGRHRRHPRARWRRPCRSTPASSASSAKASGCSGAARGCSRTASRACPTAARASRGGAARDRAFRPGRFYLTTRRGKQFNSMSYGQRDYLMGAAARGAMC